MSVYNKLAVDKTIVPMMKVKYEYIVLVEWQLKFKFEKEWWPCLPIKNWWSCLRLNLSLWSERLVTVASSWPVNGLHTMKVYGRVKE